MKFEWLRSYVAFVEEMNFTRAAKNLHISQPALHVQIKSLSAYLGVPLYVRRGRELRLTESGRRTEKFARELLDREAEYSDSLITGMDARPVVLSAGEGTYLYLLGEALKKYQSGKRPPLSLMTGNHEDTVDALLSGRAHVGVTAVGQIPDGIDVQLLTRVEQVVLLPRKHRLAKRRKLAVKDLDGEKLILPPRGRPLRTAVDQAFDWARSDFELSVECTGWEVSIEFARLGLGLPIVNSCCRIPSSLIMIPVIDLEPVQYRILTPAGGPISRAEELVRLLGTHRDSWRKRNAPR